MCSGITKKQYIEKHPGAVLDDGGSEKYAITLQNQIKKYGEVEGTLRWKEYCNKQAYSNSFEYKQIKHGWSKDDFDKYNKSRASTKTSFIKRYGEQEGTEKWKKYCELQSYAGCKVEYFIEKYGEQEGIEKWKKINRSKGRSFESFIEKYGEQEGTKRYVNSWNSNKFKNGSDIANSLWEEIIPRFKDIKIYCAINENGEFGKFNNISKRYCFYDFVIPELKFAIEFNGDIFHANPKKYKPNEIPRFRGNKKTSLEMWEADSIKQNILTEIGYDVIIIWESDFHKDCEGTIENICNLITQKSLNVK
jgi:hypothetical protein